MESPVTPMSKISNMIYAGDHRNEHEESGDHEGGGRIAKKRGKELQEESKGKRRRKSPTRKGRERKLLRYLGNVYCNNSICEVKI